MRISLYSYVTALLWSTLLVLCIRIFRKKWRLTSPLESVLLSFLYLLCMLRLFLPLDIWYSTGIRFTGIYAIIFDIFSIQKFNLGICKLSIFQMLFISIYSISIMKLLKFIVDYRTEKKLFNSCLPYINEYLPLVNERINKNFIKIPNVAILTSSVTNTPIAMGIIKKIIVLPDISYSHNELYYILLHEYTHFNRHDIVLKLFTNLFCCVFWWFPFAAFSRKDFAHTTELGCDLQVCKSLSVSEKISYAETLLSSLSKTQNSEAYTFSLSSAVTFAVRESETNLKERFHLLLQHDTSRVKKSRQLFMSAIFVLLFLFSYRFIPLPGYEPNHAEIEQDGAIYITPESAYLIIMDNNYYVVTEEDAPILVPPEFVNVMLNDGIPVKEDSSQ